MQPADTGRASSSNQNGMAYPERKIEPCISKFVLKRIFRLKKASLHVLISPRRMIVKIVKDFREKKNALSLMKRYVIKNEGIY